MSAQILVVEDNPQSLALMIYLLRQAGHTVEPAAEGAEGLGAARKSRPDLILMDIQMTGMDGYRAVAAIKSDPRLRDVPVVAVTAYAMVGDREHILRAGFDGYITKPIEPETFLDQVEAFLVPTLRSPGLPVRAAPAPVPASAPQHRKRGSATILVNDNSPDNIAFMRSVLQAFGYRVVATESAEEALDVARRSPPDLIVTDLSMQGGGGVMLLREIKADERMRRVPVVVISSSDPQDPSHLRELGAATFIRRPVGPVEFLHEVEACLPENGS